MEAAPLERWEDLNTILEEGNALFKERRAPDQDDSVPMGLLREMRGDVERPHQGKQYQWPEIDHTYAFSMRWWAKEDPSAEVMCWQRGVEFDHKRPVGAGMYKWCVEHGYGKRRDVTMVATKDTLKGEFSRDARHWSAVCTSNDPEVRAMDAKRAITHAQKPDMAPWTRDLMVPTAMESDKPLRSPRRRGRGWLPPMASKHSGEAFRKSAANTLADGEGLRARPRHGRTEHKPEFAHLASAAASLAGTIPRGERWRPVMVDESRERRARSRANLRMELPQVSVSLPRAISTRVGPATPQRASPAPTDSPRRSPRTSRSIPSPPRGHEEAPELPPVRGGSPTPRRVASETLRRLRTGVLAPTWVLDERDVGGSARPAETEPRRILHVRSLELAREGSVALSVEGSEQLRSEFSVRVDEVLDAFRPPKGGGRAKRAVDVLGPAALREASEGGSEEGEGSEGGGGIDWRDMGVGTGSPPRRTAEATVFAAADVPGTPSSGTSGEEEQPAEQGGASPPQSTASTADDGPGGGEPAAEQPEAPVELTSSQEQSPRASSSSDAPGGAGEASGQGGVSAPASDAAPSPVPAALEGAVEGAEREGPAGAAEDAAADAAAAEGAEARRNTFLGDDGTGESAAVRSSRADASEASAEPWWLEAGAFLERELPPPEGALPDREKISLINRGAKVSRPGPSKSFVRRTAPPPPKEVPPTVAIAPPKGSRMLEQLVSLARLPVPSAIPEQHDTSGDEAAAAPGPLAPAPSLMNFTARDDPLAAALGYAQAAAGKEVVAPAQRWGWGQGTGQLAPRSRRGGSGADSGRSRHARAVVRGSLREAATARPEAASQETAVVPKFVGQPVAKVAHRDKAYFGGIARSKLTVAGLDSRGQGPLAGVHPNSLSWQPETGHLGAIEPSRSPRPHHSGSVRAFEKSDLSVGSLPR